MVVKHNLMAMNANRMFCINSDVQAKSTEKLSSGYKINRAADDAAGLAISEKMRKQIRGLTQASLNAQDGISAVQTAEGALNEVQDMLQRMNELAVKAANGTMSEDDRGHIQDEINQLVDEIDRVSETTKFNETYLLKGAPTETTTVGTNVGVSMYDASAYEDKKAVVKEATGNVYSGTIASTLGTGTTEKMTISYNDAEGHPRTTTLEFSVGKDNKETAANIAEAINNDETLKTMFKATSDDAGKLSVESLQNKYELANGNANKITGLSFISSDDGNDGTLKTTITKADGITPGGDVDLAAGTSYVLDVTTLTDGDTVTIDGTTYTFDSGKSATATTKPNTFASVKDLQDLLGSDYTVEANMTYTETTYVVKGDGGGDGSKMYLESATPTPVSKDDAISDTTTLDNASTIDTKANSANLAAAKVLGTDKAAASATSPSAGNYLEYANKKLFLTITKNSQPEEAMETTTKQDALNFSFQVGADTSIENKISVDIESMSAESLGVNGLRVDGKDSTNADAAVGVIAEAIQKVSTQRSALGAVQNRLEHTIANLDNVVENTTAAESQIRDTDMATEMVKFSNNNILAQAGQAMLAQANQANQGVLSLLG